MINKEMCIIMNWNALLTSFALGVIFFAFDYIFYGFVFFISFLFLLVFNWKEWKLKEISGVEEE